MTGKGGRTIAVVGASGRQGSGVVRSLQERGTFRVRALTRNPDQYQGPAEEVARADLTDPSTLAAAFADAYGAFLVTNYWEPSAADELAQGTAAVEAARVAGVEHLVWSTLPDVSQISGGRYDVPHFTGKALVDRVVLDAGFRHASFVEAPFYFQNFTGPMAPQSLPDGSRGWALPIAADARVVHMGDIDDLGKLVAGVFESPEKAGQGQHLSLPGDRLSFDDVVSTLNRQGHSVSFSAVPKEQFATFFPGAAELAEMLGYFQEYTYLGPAATDKIELALEVSIGPAVTFEVWARDNMPAASA